MNERRIGKTPIKKICDTGRARPPPPAALYAITSDVAPKKRGRLARASLVTSHLIFRRSERCGRWCMRPAMGGLPRHSAPPAPYTQGLQTVGVLWAADQGAITPTSDYR